MQNYNRIYEYIEEYQRLVFEYYSAHGVAFLVNYYHIDSTETIWDDENLFGGAYERTGDLSGIRYQKFLNLPMYFMDDVTTIFDGQQTGYLKEGETTMVFPSSYGLTPLPGDMVKFDQTYIRTDEDTYPVFIVAGIEKSDDADKIFWKCNLKVKDSTKTTEIETQVSDIFSFLEYDKRIHTIEDATTIAKMLVKNENLSDNLKGLHDKNSGFYFLP